MLNLPTINTHNHQSNDSQQEPVVPQEKEEDYPIVFKGRVLMLYAGAGNKLVLRHLDVISGGKIRVFLDPNHLGPKGEAQATISLQGCMLADYPENSQFGFALCRTADGMTLNRLGQFIFVCFSVEDKRKLMWAIQQEVFALGGEDVLLIKEAETGEAKRSQLNKLRFDTENYVIDRGCRPPLHRGFYLKRTGNFLQEYVVRWCELRDRVSDDNPTTLGGIVYASYLAAPAKEWSFVPMRIDTKLQKSVEKNRISVSGPNQEAFFIRLDSLEVMEEWYQNLEMLVERAKIENDPQFAMSLKLNQRNESWGMAAKDQQDMIDQLGETRVMKKKSLMMMSDNDENNNNLGWGDDDNEDSDDGDGNNDNDGLDSETAHEMEDLESEVPTRVHFITTLCSLSDEPMTISAERDSIKFLPHLLHLVHQPIANFQPHTSPYKPHDNRSKMYYEQEKELENRTTSGGSAEKIMGAMNHQQQKANNNKFSGFSFGQAPSQHQLAEPIGANNNNNPSSGTTSSSSARQRSESKISTSSAEGNSNNNNNSNKTNNKDTKEDLEEKYFNPENPSVEDVLERFDRHLLMAKELLGPSPVIIRLRKELDRDANDLKHVALHIIDKYPRELKAAYLAQRMDSSLNIYNELRESVLVRIDMAKFREEFRLNASGVAVFAGGNSSFGQNTTNINGSMTNNPNNSNVNLNASPASPMFGNPSSLTAQFSRKKENPMSVDDALKVIERVTLEAGINSQMDLSMSLNATMRASRASETNAKIRDAIQFLQHFMSQFRENFDIFDDAGYLIEEVGGAIERGQNFLQEL